MVDTPVSTRSLVLLVGCLGLVGPVSGQFAPPENVASTRPEEFASGDLDGDGDVDLAVCVEALNSVYWYRNNGAGVLEVGGAFNGSGGSDVHLEDLDGDGDIDILYTAKNQDHVGWIENLGGGSFFVPFAISLDVDTPFAVHAGDLDGDGDKDVVCSSFGTQSVYWFENTGGTQFQDGQVIGSGIPNANDLALADLDEDGDVDVVVGGNGIRWLENDGNANFQLEFLGGQGALFSRVQTVDIDGDGDLDVAGPSGNAGWTYWFENEGDGDFAFAQNEFCVIEPADAYLEDINGDGKPDLAGVTFSGLWWCANRGGGVFADREFISELPGFGTRTHLADFDGDGDGEVAIAMFIPGLLLFEHMLLAGRPTCEGELNSTGQSAALSAQGSNSVGLGLISLQADSVPADQLGVFFAGPAEALIPFGNGTRCVAGSILRLGPPVSEGEGFLSVDVDWAQFGFDLASMGTSYFQCWYRDPQAGGAGFNLSSGLALTWRP